MRFGARLTASLAEDMPDSDWVLMEKVLQALATLSEMVKAAEWPARDGAEACHALTTSWHALRSKADEDGLDLWRVQPKLHVLQHLLLHVAPKWGPPTTYWS